MPIEKKEKKTALQYIQRVIENVEAQALTPQEMMADIKMMSFKVRPISGDLFSISKKHSDLLESLWRIAKIEEIVVEVLHTLEDDEKETFFSYLHMLESRFQQQVQESFSNLSKSDQKKATMTTLEIFREVSHKKPN